MTIKPITDRYCINRFQMTATTEMGLAGEYIPWAEKITGQSGLLQFASTGNGFDLEALIRGNLDFTDLDGINHPGGIITPPPLPVLPKEFWTARPVLQHIRDAAWRGKAGPDAVFGCLGAHLAGQMPHTSRIPTGIGSSRGATANYLVALVGDPSAGKTIAMDIAAELLTSNPRLPPDDRRRRGLSTGQGLIESYMGTREVEDDDWSNGGQGAARGSKKPKKTVREQTSHNRVFYLDEGNSLLTFMHQKDSVLGDVLRTAWSGGPLGSENATAERKRSVENYSLGFVVGCQEDIAQQLAGDHTLGTSQRFIWASAYRTGLPTPLSPYWEQLHAVRTTPIDIQWDALASSRWQVDKQILDDLFWEQFGIGEKLLKLSPLDGHRAQMWVKTAGLLAALDGRMKINEEDWILAMIVWETSCEVRDRLLVRSEQEQKYKTEQALEWRRRIKETELEAEDTHRRKKINRTLEKIVELIPKWAAEDKPMTRGYFNQFRSDLRSVSEEAFALGVEMGVLVEKGQRYELAEQ